MHTESFSLVHVISESLVFQRSYLIGPGGLMTVSAKTQHSQLCSLAFNFLNKPNLTSAVLSVLR